MSIKSKLTRMKTHLNTENKISEMNRPTNSIEGEVPFIDNWKEMNVAPFYFDDTYSLIREVIYPMDHQHGKYRFSDLLDAHQLWLKQDWSHPLSSSHTSVPNLLFFDTETTGLSHGAGTYIFLLGYAKFHEDKVIVRQHFLPSPDSEVAMYQAFLSEFGTSSLVSFNGKAFDWPQVKTRHTFVREHVPKLPQFPHFDLLHASRRMWKEMLPSCKLAVIEKEILEFERVEDTPSYLAPMLYFDFLQEQDPVYIKGILQHHEWDVLSLITLYTHLTFMLTKRNQQHFLHTRERFEIARWFESLGQKDMALSMYDEVSQTDGPLAFDGLFAYANIKKQQKEIEQAIKAYRLLIEANRYRVQSAIECSKVYEHQFKDIEQAFYYAKLAYSSHKEQNGMLKIKQEKLTKGIQNRLNRLENKVRNKKTLENNLFPG